VVIAPPWSEVLPLESTLNSSRDGVANSRKFRVSCGTVSICCSEINRADLGGLTSGPGAGAAETVTVSSFSRFRVCVDAT